MAMVVGGYWWCRRCCCGSRGVGDSVRHGGGDDFLFFFAPGSSSWFLCTKKQVELWADFELLVYVDIPIPNGNLSGQTSRAWSLHTVGISSTALIWLLGCLSLRVYLIFVNISQHIFSPSTTKPLTLVLFNTCFLLPTLIYLSLLALKTPHVSIFELSSCKFSANNIHH